MSNSVKQLPFVDLDLLDDIAGEVNAGGAKYTVKQANGVAAAIMQEIANQTRLQKRIEQGEKIENMPLVDIVTLNTRLVHELVPDMPDAVLSTLSQRKREIIVAMGTGLYEQLQQMIDATEKNGSGPSTQRATRRPARKSST